MTIWPPDEALRAVGPNDADVRLDDGGIELDGNGAGFYDDRAGAGGASVSRSRRRRRRDDSGRRDSDESTGSTGSGRGRAASFRSPA